jgi:hypothetical protein
MAKITSSSNRSKRSTKKPVTTSKGRANRQSVSNARVSQSGGGTPGSAKVTTGRGGGSGAAKPSGTPQMVNAGKPVMQKLVRKAAQARKAASGRPLVKPVEAQRLMSQRAPKIREGAKKLRTIGDSGQVRAAQQRGQEIRKGAEARRGARGAMKAMEGTLKAARTARNVAGTLKGLARGGVAAAALQARPAADGTLKAAMKRGDYKPKQGPKPSTTTGSFNKKTFDQAFKAARSSGANQFTWRGKKYTTKMK